MRTSIDVLVQLTVDEDGRGNLYSARFKSLASRSESSSARSEFWQGVLASANASIDDISPAECEARLKRQLGRRLKMEIVRHLQSSWGMQATSVPVKSSEDVSSFPEGLVKLETLGSFFFEVGDIRYGSAYIPLSIAGAEKLAEIFDGNFEVFQMMFSAFLPSAFEEALGIPLPAAALDFQSAYGADTIMAFARHGIGVGATASSASPVGTQAWPFNNKKALWVWAISNFSLIPFVFLGLVVAYLMLSGARDQQTINGAMLATIHEQQTKLIESYGQRIDDLSKSYKDLLDRLLAQRSGGVLASQEPGSGEAAANPATPTDASRR